jgi:hypothetical protein
MQFSSVVLSTGGTSYKDNGVDAAQSSQWLWLRASVDLAKLIKSQLIKAPKVPYLVINQNDKNHTII